MISEKRKETLRVVKFVMFSISAGVIEILSFTLLNELTDWPYWPCYLIALILSVIWNFTLNRKFTFKSVANGSGGYDQNPGLLLCVHTGDDDPGQLPGREPSLERVH